MTDKKSVSGSNTAEIALAGLLSLEPTATSAPPATDEQWRELVNLSVRGGTAGLLLEALDRRGWSSPGIVRATLRGAFQVTAAENARHRRALEGVAEAFSRGNVPLMLLKGTALNELLYDRPGLRPMADADLLIRPPDALRAGRLLEAMGYERGPGHVRDDFFPRFYYETHYVPRTGGPFFIDLHVRPWRPLRYQQTVPPEALWAGCRIIPFGRTSVRVPGAEGMFLHLAVHLACHGSSRLLWMVDLQRFIHSAGPRFDWDLLCDMARRWKLSRALLHGMEAVGKTLGQVWPAAVVEALRADGCGWKDRLALAQAPHDASHSIRHVLVDLLCTRGWRFRSSYLGAMLLPGRDHMGQFYRRRHPGWLPTAHVLRWWRATLRPLTGR
jgi:hypothetical protein